MPCRSGSIYYERDLSNQFRTDSAFSFKSAYSTRKQDRNRSKKLDLLPLQTGVCSPTEALFLPSSPSSIH